MKGPERLGTGGGTETVVEDVTFIDRDGGVAPDVDPATLGPGFVRQDRRQSPSEVLTLLGLAPQMLAVDDVARLLRCSRRTIFNLRVTDARFPRGRRVGGRVLFLADEVRAYINNLGDESPGRAA